ncbi:MAG TPA: hypothetical protein VGK81_09010 [Anaerolineae bacterium]
MKHYGLMKITFWVSVIATGILITACNASAPATSTTSATAHAAEPQLVLKPSAGTSNTQVVVEGTGFPEQTRVRVGLSPQDASQIRIYIGEVDSNDKGQFTMVYILPGIWPDGSPMDDPVLTFSAATLDEQVKASADLQDLSSTVSTLTARAGVPATPVQLQVTKDPSPLATGAAGAPPIDNAATQTVSAEQTLTGTSTPNVNASSSVVSDSIQTSVDFLYSLLRDPTGTGSVTYLSQRLRADIENNWALPTGLGIQPGYNSFEVVLLSKTDTSVLIQATLTYESGASLRNFMLIKEGDHWRIDQIVAGSR